MMGQNWRSDTSQSIRPSDESVTFRPLFSYSGHCQISLYKKQQGLFRYNLLEVTRHIPRHVTGVASGRASHGPAGE